jgi:hypothetical protein
MDTGTGMDSGGGDGGGPMDGGIGCTKPSDCMNGFCCGTFQTGMGQPPQCLQTGTYSTKCTQTCNTVASFMCNSTNTRRLCSMKSQCSENMYPQCCQFTFNMQMVEVCVSNTEAAFIQQNGGTCL